MNTTPLQVSAGGLLVAALPDVLHILQVGLIVYVGHIYLFLSGQPW